MIALKIMVQKIGLFLNKKFLIFLIIILAFFIRLHNIQFPYFTSDEARIAFRGYTLSTLGKDELGRSFPLVFNSLEDYQLPAVSYLTAFGELFFGKTDVGVRMPFIIISVLLIVLIYKTTEVFLRENKDFIDRRTEFKNTTALVVVFTPAFIYLSKIPNESIVLAFIFLLLFFLLIQERLNLLAIAGTMILCLTVSKLAWWYLLPFTVVTLIYFQENRQKKICISILAFVMTMLVLLVFLRIPQATRSLTENNFSMFGDNSIAASINRLRGQGVQSGFPVVLEKIIFNKFHFFTVGLINWLTNINPAILFAQFDKEGIAGFSSMGAFAKVLIIPFLVGLACIVKQGKSHTKVIFFYFLIFTFPAIFIYPVLKQSFIIPALPFLIVIITFGLMKMKLGFRYLVILLMAIEVILNISFITPEVKAAGLSRPVWIKNITDEAFHLSQDTKVAISDDLVADLSSFFGWYAKESFPLQNAENLPFPYKFNQARVANIRIVGNDDTFYFCGLDKPTFVYASNRDLAKIQKWLNIDTPKTVQKIYNNDFNQKSAYLLKSTICVH